MKPFAIAATFALSLTLAACGNAPEAPAADPAPAEAPVVETAPAAESPAVTLEIPSNTMVPGTDVTVEEAMENVQQQVGDMQLTEAEKLQAVADARTTAEDAARNAGLTDEQIKQAGDAAEQAARTMFGLN